MTIWDFMDKHMGWTVVFGLAILASAFSLVVRIEQYTVNRLRTKIRLAELAAKKGTTT